MLQLPYRITVVIYSTKDFEKQIFEHSYFQCRFACEIVVT
jgi:hypothetical protein